MDQIHRRFSTDHVRNLLRGYTEGLLGRSAVDETLGINKSRFFALLKVYRDDPEAFSITYQRSTPRKLSAAAEEAIKNALLAEKAQVENPDLPISSYNYSAIRDRLVKQGIRVSVPTIITRAKVLGCYQDRPKKKLHDREVLNTAIGACRGQTEGGQKGQEWRRQKSS